MVQTKITATLQSPGFSMQSVDSIHTCFDNDYLVGNLNFRKEVHKFVQFVFNYLVMIFYR